ncbi:MAG: PepSY domain-containing protein [Planctomycetes bacterium]|nr:PepSY domain-containing protein [Planctomycetota bacterium]
MQALAKSGFPIVVAFLVVGAGPATAKAQDQEIWQALVAKATFTLEEAIDRGLAEAASGTVFQAELEVDKGKLVYSIDVAQEKRSLNVVIGAADGKVLEKDRESDDMSKAIAACKIGIKAALQAAVLQQPGTVIEARLLLEKGQPFYHFRILTDSKLESLRIDGSAVAPVRKEQDASSLIYTDRFFVNKEDLRAHGRNPYFILEPGHVLEFAGEEDGESAQLVITVLAETRKVDGVTTSVVEERESKAGKLVEISRNYFAISTRTNDVFYFGEEVDMYEDGKIVSHDGAWLSGVDGARFGLIMPGSPLIGARYYQEIAPGIAMDRAVVESVGGSAVMPAGRFENCLTTLESSALENGTGTKIYAYDVGLLHDGELKLVRYGPK